MEHRQDSQASAEMLGIGCDVQQRLRRAGEEQVVKPSWVGQSQRIELVGNRKDDMEVRHGQKLAATLLQPALLVQALALGAVPVTARVVGDLLRAALLTHVHMPTQSSGAAELDSPHGP